MMQKHIYLQKLLTSSSNGIAGTPFMFFGFNRGNNDSIKACPPGLKMITIMQEELQCRKFI